MSTTVLHGDCIAIMAEMPDASVDSIVTDPPYGLGFMGKEWDALPPSEPWARECLRVLKPGGHLLAFGGTRTWHRLAVAVEDAGFEIRDSIAWLYGSGFPKSLDVSKAIDKAAGAEREVVGTKLGLPGYSLTNGNGDHRTYSRGLGNTGSGQAECDVTAPATLAAKQWQGWGTALKPAFEPIVFARKPIVGTVAANVQMNGVGALNIDACRIETTDSLGGGANKAMTSDTRHAGWSRPWMDDANLSAASAERSRENTARAEALGRWPANVALDTDMANVLDQQSGITKDTSHARQTPKQGTAALGNFAGNVGKVVGHNDSGGASRFFYVAKAPARERPRVNGIAHPTVKPLTLMRWLIRLVTPPGGTVLDPFAGSGTTLEAALLEGFSVIGIELQEEYLPLIEQRLNRSQGA